MNSESQDNTVLKVTNLRKEFGGLIAVKDVSQWLW
jgi:ABC-type branched-subunit amino acid transport system ATPase component